MITLITTYYNEPEHLHKFLSRNYNEDVISEVIIVDDGSQIHPATKVVKNFPHIPMKLFRITEDLGFNSHGARNLAMKHVDTEWALLTDIDRKGYAQFSYILERYIQSSKDKEYFNWLDPRSDRTFNEYCIRVEDFWISGGYDEETVNKHFGDRLFIDRLDSYLDFTTIMYNIGHTRFERNWSSSDTDITLYPDDETIIHPRWNGKDKRNLIDLIGFRNDHPDLWIRDNILQFDWERII